MGAKLEFQPSWLPWNWVKVLMVHLRTNLFTVVCLVTVPGLTFLFSSCDHSTAAGTAAPQAAQAVTVGVIPVERHAMERQLTVSSELVPFQEIQVYAKESGYVNRLLVDYGSHVKKGQLMAVLEIPELAAQLEQDKAAVKSMQDQVTNAQHQLSRVEAQHKVLHLEYQRMNDVAQSKPGLVAQQEVDDVQGRDLAAEAQVDASKSSLEAAKSNMAASEAKVIHDQDLFSYSRITAPFDGVVTERDANLGTLLQAGTSSSTQAMPLVKLSQENLYRLVIPVPETYVRYIKSGDDVSVRIPALSKDFPGKVTRFSFEVHDATRTMHTEVDVANPSGELLPGMYAEATLTLNRTGDALTVPVQAINRQGDNASVLVVDPSNHVQVRGVSLGAEGQTENEVEVLSGLNDGDRVVVSEQSGLKPGEEVRPQVAPPATYKGRV